MNKKFYVTSEELNKDIRQRHTYISLGMIFGQASAAPTGDNSTFTTNILEGVEGVAKSLYESANGVHSLRIIPSVADTKMIFYQGIAYRNNNSPSEPGKPDWNALSGNKPTPSI